MTRVRFLRQWTVKTKSDHLALFVAVRLTRRRRGRRKSVVLVLCTANLGGDFDEDDLRLLLAEDPDILACQEASDQKWIVEVAEELGFQLLDGEPSGQVGQAATPTFAGPRVVVRRPGKWKQLLGAAKIGKGSGPDTSKPKWWLKTRLAVEGIAFSASSWHATVSQQFWQRFLAALSEAKLWVGISLNLRRPSFTLGDTNSDLQQRLSAWILAHGMTSNHEQLGEIATRGGRSIDAVCVQRRLVES